VSAKILRKYTQVHVQHSDFVHEVIGHEERADGLYYRVARFNGADNRFVAESAVIPCALQGNGQEVAKPVPGFPGALCPHTENAEGCANCQAALERARVVAVLDAWAEKSPTDRHWATYPGDAVEDEPFCSLGSMFRNKVRNFTGPTPDAARSAAAKAIEAGEV